MERQLPPTLIALTGKAGSGKDLVASMLRMVGYKRFGFADELREEVIWASETGTQTGFEEIDRYIRNGSGARSEVYKKPMESFTRTLLQKWGTNYRRGTDPEYWIKKLQTKLEHEICKVVISDLRFQNEADWVERHDGVLWRVDRPGVTNMSHVSETEMDSLKPDRVILNNGNQYDLAESILEALEEPYGIAKTW